MRPRTIIVLSIFAILALGILGVARWMRPYNLVTERAAARVAGVPLSIKDLPQRNLAPGQNAAVEYAALAKLETAKPLDTKAVEAAIPKGGNGTVPRASTAVLRALVEGRPDVTRLVHAAGAKPHAEFGVEQALGDPLSTALLFPQLARLRSAARWIRWESLAMARDGRYEQAVANQALGFRIAQHGADQPQLIAYLVSVASETIALSGMADILAEAGPNAATADAVRRAISAGLPNRTLAGALKGEALCGGTLIRMSPSVRDTMPSDPDGPPPVILYTKPNAFARWWWNDPAEAIYLHWMTRMIQAAETPVEGRTAAMSKVAEDIKRASGGQPAYVLTSMLVPTFSRACERDAQTAARRMVISSAAAVLAYRARHGVYPVTLEQAVSPAPVDPLTGRPLEYTATKTGFLVAAHPDATGLDAKKARSLTESLQFRYPRDEG